MSLEDNGNGNDKSFSLELQVQPKIEAHCIAPEGLGFGEGAISYASRAMDGQLSGELNKAESILKTPRVLTPIDVDKNGDPIDDDGCGDGRGVADEAGNIVEVTQGDLKLDKSLNRAKVFGGGATMALAARIALGRADVPLQGLFSDARDDLDEAGIDFGAHSDEHAHGEKSGCGAIDNAPKIIENVVKYRRDIHATIKSLDENVDEAILDDVLDKFVSYDESTDQTDYSGKNVLDYIKQDEKVVKKLVSDHREMFIVLNEVEGHTVDQHAVREESDGQIQAFAVDMWRLRDIADRLYGDGEDDSRQRALLGELVYTLATAATLTDGSLPVYQTKLGGETANV